MSQVFVSEDEPLRLTLSLEKEFCAADNGIDALTKRQLFGVMQRALNIGTNFETSFYWSHDSAQSLLRVDLEVVGAGSGRSVNLLATSESQLPYDLTPRELDVLTLVSGGLANAAIAGRLFLSVRTATTHVDRILRKLGAPSRTSAAVLAAEEYLLKLPIPGGPEGFERLLIGKLDGASMIEHAPSSSPRFSRLSELVIGAAFPMTGPARVDGLQMLTGTELAIEEVNARGGIGGRRLRLIVEDIDLNSEESVSLAFHRLVDQNPEAFVSGYVGYQETAHQITAGPGAPYLNAATLDSYVRLVAEQPDRFGHSFQVCASDVHYGHGFVAFLSWLRDTGNWRPSSDRLVAVRGAWKDGTLGYSRMQEEADAKGWRITEYLDNFGENADHAGHPWASEARRIAATDPAAVLISAFYLADTVEFVRAFREVNHTALLYCLYTPSLPEFRARLGDLAEGILWATTTGTYSDHLGREFAERYRNRYGKSPGRSHAGISYDRVKLLAEAWARADNPYDFEQVNGILRSSQYRGVNGAYTFRSLGQSTEVYPLTCPDPSIAQAHLVFQIQNGRQRILWPQPYSETNFQPLLQRV